MKISKYNAYQLMCTVILIAIMINGSAKALFAFGIIAITGCLLIIGENIENLNKKDPK